MKTWMRIFSSAILTTGLLCSAAWADDNSEITASMKAVWDKPDHPLVVKPVVVADQYAIAGWLQDNRGGRALLQKGHHGWQTQLCAGKITAELLQQAGVPSTTAKQLLAKLPVAEQALSEAEVGRLSSFSGIVKMDQAGHHEHAHAASTASAAHHH
ncbi:copper uptake system-associated protein [Chitinibacter bivalviorum]|uniref:Copper uptake system-associated protein n=1 Tax=Chitinibacter bivalviorum TaxID=2739434 RepID=A0A7H9BML7_9NEIS|nr:copper uptake system-associated protein [Chitinibacter bivalviorum]QLG89682.1 copper uptake system-associated protein [Chitinibacter bivalviorum]